MKAVDTVEEVCRLQADSFSLEAWEDYAGRISPALPKKVRDDASSYEYEREILPVIRAALADKEKLKEVQRSFAAALRPLPERLALIGCPDLQVDIILYLGLCNGAGWATELENRKVILLGIEKIVELGWTDETAMKALLYHEAGHICHGTLRTVAALEAAGPREYSMRQLYEEGMAMYAEQLLCGDFGFYHQDKDGWLAWCEEHRESLFREWIRRMDGEESTADFFGDWRSYDGHSDVGYFLGCEWIKDLLTRKSFRDAANLSLDELEAELFRFVAGMSA
ncbi:hypothetical protein [Gorillibacterium sp. sgz500922]|uniref:hypothetical protein n=1 Tax=Gorillibacterium sp. sgz500922 TaxID=3446694 RepID=UPI003F6664AE